MVDGQAVLRLSGDLDMDSAELFAEAARRVHAERIPSLVLDLSALDFVDSSGLSQFVLALKRQREIGGEVVLQAPTSSVRRLPSTDTTDPVAASHSVVAESSAAPDLCGHYQRISRSEPSSLLPSASGGGPSAAGCSSGCSSSPAVG